MDAGDEVIAVEVKSGATVAPDFLTGLERFRRVRADAATGPEPVLRLVYGGDQDQMRKGIDVVPWSGIQDRSWV